MRAELTDQARNARPSTGLWARDRTQKGATVAQRNDPVFILATGHYTNFDFVVRVDGQTVRLTTEPEGLVFQEV
jgi:hypothetical protein